MSDQPNGRAHGWTPEKVAALDKRELANLLENAKHGNAADVVSMCEAELTTRAPAKVRSGKLAKTKRPSDFVSEYHFVCGRDRGVIELGNGRFTSGSWVVSVENVRRSLQYGAILALHETKAHKSYRQGRITKYEIASREMVAGKVEEGVEFLVEAFDEPLDWYGDGAGEKGYRWAPVVAKASNEASGLSS